MSPRILSSYVITASVMSLVGCLPEEWKVGGLIPQLRRTLRCTLVLGIIGLKQGMVGFESVH